VRAGRRDFLALVGATAFAALAPSLRAGRLPDQSPSAHRRCSPEVASTSSRTIGDRLGRALGQSIVVENMSGGGGVVGSLATARAAPDGYTLMVGYVGTHGTNPAVRKLPYDAIRDFTPIAMVGGTPNVLVVDPSLAVATLRELVAYAKASPGKLSYGSSGPGTLTHLAMEQLKVAADLDIVHSLSRHRPRLRGPAGRADADHVPGARGGAAAHQGRQGEAARRDRHAAARAAA
jgi:hypothetical protein